MASSSLSLWSGMYTFHNFQTQLGAKHTAFHFLSLLELKILWTGLQCLNHYFWSTAAWSGFGGSSFRSVVNWLCYGHGHLAVSWCKQQPTFPKYCKILLVRSRGKAYFLIARWRTNTEQKTSPVMTCSDSMAKLKYRFFIKLNSSCAWHEIALISFSKQNWLDSYPFSTVTVWFLV